MNSCRNGGAVIFCGADIPVCQAGKNACPTAHGVCRLLWCSIWRPRMVNPNTSHALLKRIIRSFVAASMLGVATSCWCGAAAAQAPTDPAAAKKDDQPSSIEAVEQHIKELRTQYAAKPDDKLKAEMLT